MVILHPKEEHLYTLIWLHGLDGHARNFKDMFLDHRLMKLPPNCKIVFPTAKRQAVTFGGRIRNLTSWYDIRTFDEATDFDPDREESSADEPSESSSIDT
jgi:predicted esterase